jgi:hypothetical protein
LQCSDRLPQGRVQTRGHAFNVDRQAILGGSAPGRSHLWDPVPFVSEIIGRHTIHSSLGKRGQSLPLNEGSQGPPIQAPATTIKIEELQVILTIEKHKVSLLINTGASISAIPFSPGPRSSKKITVQGISGQPLEHYFTQSIACSWGYFHFCHSFLIVTETPTPQIRSWTFLFWENLYCCYIHFVL